MKLMHVVAVAVGIAATVWGVRLMFTDPPAAAPAPLPAAGPHDVELTFGEGDPNVRPSQVTMLAGPGVTPDAKTATDAPRPDVPDSRALRNESRRAAVEEVLKNLDGAAVWVEGVDGPAPVAPPRKPR